MTPEQFRRWRKALDMSQRAAADALGLSTGSIANYESGFRRDTNEEVTIPRAVALACAAITKGLSPYGDESELVKFTETTDEGGVIVLVKYPESGYRLRYHGQIVWRQEDDVTIQRPALTAEAPPPKI